MKLSSVAIGRLAGLAGGAIACAIFLWWEIAHRGPFTYATGVYQFDDADEWRYTACSRLVEHGYTLFDQVFSAQPPLLFLSLAQGMRLFGDSISGARWMEIGYGLVALLATIWITWLLAGPVAAAAAGFLLAVSPAFLVYSRAVEAEIPMMALVTLSLALVVLSRTLQWRVLPIGAGLVLATAILMKLFAIEALVPALWVLVWPSRDRRSLVSTASFVLAAVLPVALEMALVSPGAQWEQVITLHSKAARVSLPGALPPWHVLGNFLTLDLGLTVLATAGIAALAVLGVWDDLTFILLWGGGALLMLLLFRPLFPHHPVILLSAFAVAAGIATTVWIEQLRSRRWLAAVPIGLGVLAYLALAPRLAHDDRHDLLAGLTAQRVQLGQFTEEKTAPADFVAVDDLAIADLAHRLVPPGLCDPSTVRLRAGYLTASELVGQTRKYRARLVLPFGVFHEVPAYLAWLRHHYESVPAPDGLTAYMSR